MILFSKWFFEEPFCVCVTVCVSETERERERERKRIEGFVCVSQSRVPPRTTMVLVLWYLELELYFYVLFRDVQRGARVTLLFEYFLNMY